MFKRPTDPTRTEMRDALRAAESKCPAGHVDTEGLALNTFHRTAWCPTCGMPAWPPADFTDYPTTSQEATS